jgi:hypothetical protein
VPTERVERNGNRSSIIPPPLRKTPTGQTRAKNIRRKEACATDTGRKIPARNRRRTIRPYH